MLGAFAQGKNVRGGGLQAIVDADAAPAVQARGLCQRDIGANPRGDHGQIGADHPAVGQRERLDPRAAVYGAGARAGDHADAPALERGDEFFGGQGVELVLHQQRGEVHHGDGHTPGLQARGRFQPQQPAADHHRPRLFLIKVRASVFISICAGIFISALISALASLPASGQHTLDIGQRAIGIHASQRVARQGRHKRL